MNEFTKEELEYINNYIFHGAASIRMDHHELLKNKLQSMIDNYCDQKEKSNHHPICPRCTGKYTATSSSRVTCRICSKCKKEFFE
jgi:NADH pyrophosphatase NudC (nudix superfamily)